MMTERRFCFKAVNTVISDFMLVSGTICHGAAVEHIKGDGAIAALPGEFPSVVTIHRKGTNELVGSGVLLRSRVVLITGSTLVMSYLSPSDITVVLGMHNRNIMEPTRQEIDVTHIKINPEGLKKRFKAADLALLRLKQEPNRNAKSLVKVLGAKNIATAEEDDEIMGDSSSCIVMGYGIYKNKLPNRLKKFVPQVVKSRDCEGFTGAKNYRRKKLLCSVNDDDTGACTGDAGASLFCEKDGEMKLHGLVMGWSQFCSIGLTYYTRLSSSYNWIKTTAQNLQTYVDA